MDQPSEKAKRPEVLKVLCILTFVGSGLSGFSYAFLSLFQDAVFEIASSDQFGFFRNDDEKNLVLSILSLPAIFNILHVILYASSVFGAYLMWNLRKIGFHFYAISQISLLIVYKAFIPSAPFPFFPLAVTVIFILLYFQNLKHMN